MLDMSVWTLRRWVYAGKAPSIKTKTGTVFIPARWIEEQGVPNGPAGHTCPTCGQRMPEGGE